MLLNFYKLQMKNELSFEGIDNFIDRGEQKVIGLKSEYRSWNTVNRCENVRTNLISAYSGSFTEPRLSLLLG